jgi:hypothetical protein
VVATAPDFLPLLLVFLSRLFCKSIYSIPYCVRTYLTILWVTLIGQSCDDSARVFFVKLFLPGICGGGGTNIGSAITLSQLKLFKTPKILD